MTQPQQRETAVTELDHCRDDFPALSQEVNGCPLIYLDNAASAQPPISVIETIAEY